LFWQLTLAVNENINATSSNFRIIEQKKNHVWFAPDHASFYAGEDITVYWNISDLIAPEDVKDEIDKVEAASTSAKCGDLTENSANSAIDAIGKIMNVINTKMLDLAAYTGLIVSSLEQFLESELRLSRAGEVVFSAISSMHRAAVSVADAAVAMTGRIAALRKHFSALGPSVEALVRKFEVRTESERGVVASSYANMEQGVHNAYQSFKVDIKPANNKFRPPWAHRRLERFDTNCSAVGEQVGRELLLLDDIYSLLIQASDLDDNSSLILTDLTATGQNITDVLRENSSAILAPLLLEREMLRGVKELLRKATRDICQPKSAWVPPAERTFDMAVDVSICSIHDCGHGHGRNIERGALPTRDFCPDSSSRNNVMFSPALDESSALSSMKDAERAINKTAAENTKITLEVENMRSVLTGIQTIVVNNTLSICSGYADLSSCTAECIRQGTCSACKVPSCTRVEILRSSYKTRSSIVGRVVQACLWEKAWVSADEGSGSSACQLRPHWSILAIPSFTAAALSNEGARAFHMAVTSFLLLGVGVPVASTASDLLAATMVKNLTKNAMCCLAQNGYSAKGCVNALEQQQDYEATDLVLQSDFTSTVFESVKAKHNRVSIHLVGIRNRAEFSWPLALSTTNDGEFQFKMPPVFSSTSSTSSFDEFYITIRAQESASTRVQSQSLQVLPQTQPDVLSIALDAESIRLGSNGSFSVSCSICGLDSNNVTGATARHCAPNAACIVGVALYSKHGELRQTLAERMHTGPGNIVLWQPKPHLPSGQYTMVAVGTSNCNGTARRTITIVPQAAQDGETPCADDPIDLNEPTTAGDWCHQMGYGIDMGVRIDEVKALCCFPVLKGVSSSAQVVHPTDFLRDGNCAGVDWSSGSYDESSGIAR
jgi:hypothetical protein